MLRRPVASLLIRHGTVAVLWALLATDAVVGQADAPPFVEGSTTIVVLPDTERYSDDHPRHFHAQTKWVASQQEARNIAYVVHLGDITQHNAPAEWEVARRCFGRIDGRVPYALAAGNHDYDGNAPNRETSRLSEHFPVRRFRECPTFGGVFEADRAENCYHLVRIGGRDWIILVLEMGPRDEVVAWANDVLASHPERSAMVVTHAYLYRNNVRYDHRIGRQRASPHGWGNDGEELWQKLVRRHANVMIVLSGHVSTGGLGYLASEGDYGNTVHQMMVDYEKERQGGMGYLRMLEFLPDARTVQVRTWSPSVGEARTSALEEFRFRLAGPTRETPLPAAPGPAGLRRGPIHRYSFDPARGDPTRVTDRVGGAHGTLIPGSSDSGFDQGGRLLLSGDGHVRLPPRLLKEHEDLSFEVWFTPTSDRYRWNSVVRFGDPDDWFTYVFRTLTVHRAEIAVARHNEDIQRKVPVRPGEPLHVIVTYDHDAEGGKPRLAYSRNGKLVATMPTSLRLTDVDDTASIIGPLAASFDELRVYDFAVSEAEASVSFEAGPDALKVASAGSAAAPDGAPERAADQRGRVPIIFDTDMDTDCDDAGALAMLHVLADAGEVEILATVVSSRYPWSAPCVEAINRHCGRPDLPIGVPKGEGAGTSRGSRYAKTIARSCETRLRRNDDAPSAVEVYRRALASGPDRGVVVVTVGYLTNLRDLLASGPDAHSELSGRDLVSRKVARWICMGGRYPRERNRGVHGNFKPDPESAVMAVAQWPGLVYFSGRGKRVQTGSLLRARRPPEDPVRRIYDLYLGERPTRPSWDQVALLYAVRPGAPFWRVRADGRNHVFADGTNEWRDEPDDPRHRLIDFPDEASDRIARIIDHLMVGEPR